MSVAATQAAAFYREVAEHGSVWTLADAGGYPAPLTASGKRSQPFWSLRSRAERIASTVPAYAGFHVEEVRWEAFVASWAPGLESDGLLVGINWSGVRATGYDLMPSEVIRNVEAVRGSGQ